MNQRPIIIDGHKFEFRNGTRQKNRLTTNVKSYELWVDDEFRGFMFRLEFNNQVGERRTVWEFSSLDLETEVSSDLGFVLRSLIK